MNNASSFSVPLRLLGAFFLTLSACSTGGEAPSSDSVKSSAADASDGQVAYAEFALAYKASSQELLIARTQQRVVATPADEMAYVALAEAFLVRKRETSNARYFALATDAMGAARALAPDNTAVRTSAVAVAARALRRKSPRGAPASP